MEEIDEAQWRQCRLCQGKSRLDSHQWLQACLCPQPYHRHCLQYYVWICETKHPEQTPACFWCRALFRVEPAKGFVISALEMVAHNNWYPTVCVCVAFITFQAAVFSACACFGLQILGGVYGTKMACSQLMKMDPIVAVTLCHNLPVFSIIVNYIPWEDYFLRMLRTCHRLPVLGAVMPTGGPELRPLKQRPLSICGAVVGGLFLPNFSRIIGNVFFSTEKSPCKRLLLGGAFFLAVRGIFYMYYQQKKFMRKNHLTVANYTTNE